MRLRHKFEVKSQEKKKTELAEANVAMTEISNQVFSAFGYYLILVLLFRLSGKRSAGQITSFDLLILISFSVALQQALLEKGLGNAFIFMITVFCAHHLLALCCQHSPGFKLLVRGGSTELIRDGDILHRAMREEGITLDELLAGLRKAGADQVAQVKTAHIEETGQISAVLKKEG